MKTAILYSGSTGNCTYFTINNKLILLDVGVSIKKLNKALMYHNYNISDIEAIMITHEHNDHAQGLKKLVDELNIKLYITKKTYEVIEEKSRPNNTNNIYFFEDNFQIQSFNVSIFVYKSSHDCQDGNFFSFSHLLNKTKLFAYICDTGYVNEKYIENLKNHEAYLIESNHEPELLLRSGYPWHLQRRILSHEGHLSNGDALNILKKVIGNKTKFLYFFHLSQKSNHEDILRVRIQNMLKRIDRTDIKFMIATEKNFHKSAYLFQR